ncbi:MAG: DNA-3-methyladenine glycosylase I [Pseudonocardiales bacterium]|nr:DNA-3-methyladenine glycosylase I [Pseudonocardiales bacterium]MBV9030720.1 DNA-3-methyladenine glycosylase I [Pseudonocardiales bacterium]MBW0011322.1 DNA-3-methyladenine glycosylase I [Pseudonocardiales bacterium]
MTGPQNVGPEEVGPEEVGPEIGAVAGTDGRPRCPWAGSAPDYRDYHDDEWGVPVHGARALFERLSLEAFQSGLSWLTILRKREAFRRAFAGFHPATVAAFTDDDVARLLADAAIVRHRAKIEATVHNARAVTALGEDLDALLWSYAPDPAGRPAPRTAADVPARTPESEAMARMLRRRGFTFVGPVTCHALMQATGMVDDHLVGCFRRGGE